MECTLKVSDVDAKVGKLVHRREALVKALASDHPGIQVLSVLVCQAERLQIATQEQELAHKGVLLISREDLQFQIDTNLHVPVDPERTYLNLVQRLAQLTAPPPDSSDPPSIF